MQGSRFESVYFSFYASSPCVAPLGRHYSSPSLLLRPAIRSDTLMMRQPHASFPGITRFEPHPGLYHCTLSACWWYAPRRGAPNYSLFTIHYSLFTIHYSRFPHPVHLIKDRIYHVINDAFLIKNVCVFVVHETTVRCTNLSGAV